MQPNRRQFVRLRTRLTTVFKIVKTGKVRRGLTRDVSGGGLCFVSEELLAPGTSLGIELKLPDRNTPITFSAEVVWSRPVGEPPKSYEAPTIETGVKFVAVDSKNVAILRQYATLNAHHPEPKDT